MSVAPMVRSVELQLHGHDVHGPDELQANDLQLMVI